MLLYASAHIAFPTWVVAPCSDEDGIQRPTHETNVYVEDGKEGSVHGGPNILGRRARPTTPKATTAAHTNGSNTNVFK